MGNCANILNMVKSLLLFVSWNTSPWFTRVNSLQNTETPEILDRNLEHFKAFRSTDEGRFQPRIVFFLFLSHAREFSFGAHLRVACSLDGLLLLATLHSIPHCFVCLKIARVDNLPTMMLPGTTLKNEETKKTTDISEIVHSQPHQKILLCWLVKRIRL